MPTTFRLGDSWLYENQLSEHHKHAQTPSHSPCVGQVIKSNTWYIMLAEQFNCKVKAQNVYMPAVKLD